MMKKFVFPLLAFVVLGFSIQHAHPFISVIIEEFKYFFYQESEDGANNKEVIGTGRRFRIEEYDDRTGARVPLRTKGLEKYKNWSTEDVGKFYEDHRAQIENGSIVIKRQHDSINVGQGEILGRLDGDQVVRISNMSRFRAEVKSYQIIIDGLGELPQNAVGDDTPTSKNKPVTSQALSFFDYQDNGGIPSSVNNSVALSKGVSLDLNADLGPIERELSKEESSLVEKLSSAVQESVAKREKLTSEIKNHIDLYNKAVMEIVSSIPETEIVKNALKEVKEFSSDPNTPLGKEIRDVSVYLGYAEKQASEPNKGLVSAGKKILKRADDAASSGNPVDSKRKLKLSDDFARMALNPVPKHLEGDDAERYNRIRAFVISYNVTPEIYLNRINEMGEKFRDGQSPLTSQDQLDAAQNFAKVALALANKTGIDSLKEINSTSLKKKISGTQKLLNAFNDIVGFGTGVLKGLDKASGRIVHDFVKMADSGLGMILNPVDTYNKATELIENFSFDAFADAASRFVANKSREFTEADEKKKGEMIGLLMGDIGLAIVSSATSPAIVIGSIASKTKLATTISNTVKTIRKISPHRIRRYLRNVDKIPRKKLIQDMESIGLKVKGKSPDGKFMEFVDKSGNVRAKIHPPDKITKYHHLHIYDKNGTSLNKLLKAVVDKSSEAHIPIGD